VIGNGLVGPREVMRRMQGGRPSGRFISFLAWLRQMTDAKSNLLKVYVEAGNRLPDPRRAQDFALHLRLIEAAFFGDREAGFGLETGNSRSETGKGKSEKGNQPR